MFALIHIVEEKSASAWMLRAGLLNAALLLPNDYIAGGDGGIRTLGTEFTSTTV
jgi:hypothetical protein